MWDGTVLLTLSHDSKGNSSLKGIINAILNQERAFFNSDVFFVFPNVASKVLLYYCCCFTKDMFYISQRISKDH